MGYLLKIVFFTTIFTHSTLGFITNLAELQCGQCTLLNSLECCEYKGRCCPFSGNPGECPSFFDNPDCEDSNYGGCLHDDDCNVDEKCCTDVLLTSCCRKALPDSGFWPFIDPEPYPYPIYPVYPVNQTKPVNPDQPAPPVYPYPAFVPRTVPPPEHATEQKVTAVPAG